VVISVVVMVFFAVAFLEGERYATVFRFIFRGSGVAARVSFEVEGEILGHSVLRIYGVGEVVPLQIFGYLIC
jgi:hypothetical protein